MSALPFIPARNFYTGRRAKVRLLVVHDMEMLQGPTTAESCARFFQNQSTVTQPKSSAHFCCDENSIVQSVRVGDTAWAAPNANANGVHFELAGKATESRIDWLSNSNDAMMNLASGQVALIYGLMRYLGVPVELRRLSPQDILAGKAGLCGHIDITNAYNPGGHTDPGPNFPWDVFLDKVKWWVAQFDAHGWPTPNYR